ncbi:hypothetical protein RFM41_29365 [Mesorhizobium sp. VK25A]|uniref:Uncharacterized protein n=1 Tax=Mesorhizobium vachelliae TaxID=3072309 RepID=A0ABU5A767_9HYPH|nr:MULTISPECIES: hypothetical protein [unclassified Mesorhizobium]MDX8532467.1 hypothetical protein [Mesorhizobium sp. VK25D]MDX8547887.1 hypothetical protein [Mesorhizobium sp. VK25A]
MRKLLIAAAYVVVIVVGAHSVWQDREELGQMFNAWAMEMQ